MNTLRALSATLLAAGLLTACGNDDDDPAPANTSYSVSIVNLTNNQPLSPLAALTHGADFSPWTVGAAASDGLEQLAEGGDNSVLLGAGLSGQDVVGVSGASAIGPGGSDSLTLTTSASSQDRISVLTMLVNTNDAFAGVAGIDVSGLASGQSMTVNAPVYDAGTEANSEAAGTIPGPADGGSGFDAVRDDSNRVSRHSGVVTTAGGLATSRLDQSHRFDNPVMRIRITRQ